jgi:hypothetical protein
MPTYVFHPIAQRTISRKLSVTMQYEKSWSIFVTYHMDTKKATDVKDNRLYECFVASGGCSFLETFKLCMNDVLSQNLINEM